MIIFAIFNQEVLADDDDGCTYENGCLANPPFYTSPYFYPSPGTSYVYPTPGSGYSYPSPSYIYPTPSYIYPTPSYVYPTPSYSYPTPGYSYPSPYTYPTPSGAYAYPTPAAGGSETNVVQIQDQTQDATGGDAVAVGGEGGTAIIGRVTSQSQSSGGSVSVSVSQPTTQNPNPEIRVVTQQQPRVTQVAGASAVKELPKTGTPLLAWALGALSLGFGLKRFYKGLSKNIPDDAEYIWQLKRFKSHKS